MTTGKTRDIITNKLTTTALDEISRRREVCEQTSAFETEFGYARTYKTRVYVRNGSMDTVATSGYR